ncbi:hypothetical protein EDD31_1789 [Bogoriella caseilytica]|uniref:Uncharacterized protein n=1 Tax=Bogoriella caseilytica TaxID=56055 RepID=A0A3N2BDT1_9MICO|nr:hypothetical protein EDD31_1789 [Bogoriella caseilytica]
MLKTVIESKEIQSYMTDPASVRQIADIAADALDVQHRSDADAGPETEGA